MKKLITLIAIATLTLTFGAFASAQDAGPQGGTMQAKSGHKGMGGLKLIEKIQKDVLPGLKLTHDQYNKIDALNKATEEKVKAMHKANKGSTDKAASQDARKELMKSYSDSMKSILTADQFKTYHEQMRAKMKEYRDAHQKDANGKP